MRRNTVMSLVVIIGIGLIIYSLNDLIKGISSKNWQSVEGRIVTATTYSNRAFIQYVYELNGASYKGSKVSFGLFSGTFDVSAQMRKYDENDIVDVYYNESDPMKSVLEPGIGDAVLPFLLGFVIVLVGIFGFRLKLGFLDDKIK